MKSDVDQNNQNLVLNNNNNNANLNNNGTLNSNTNINTNGSAGENNSTTYNNLVLFTAQRKGAVHDLSQILVEDCQKLMTECHKLLSKYQNDLVVLSNSYLSEGINKEELRSLRIQCYMTMKANLDKLLPQVDQ
jgi:hypothetical protein